MNIAIASGKGGTGKTTTAASLVHVWPRPVVAVDLDVEEPNLHLFLKPEISDSRKATMQVPEADESKCIYCRMCAELCQFKAITVLGEVLLTFPEMCHGCGGCMAICPEGALSVGRRELGDVLWGRAANADFLMGRLRVGEAMSPPLMRSVKQRLAEMNQGSGKDVIVDAPPGVSCPAVNAVMDSDAIILVTEPTPFGLYDLQLAFEAFTPLGKTHGGGHQPAWYRPSKGRRLLPIPKPAHPGQDSLQPGGCRSLCPGESHCRRLAAASPAVFGHGRPGRKTCDRS